MKTFLESNYRYTLDRPLKRIRLHSKTFWSIKKKVIASISQHRWCLLLRQMGIAARVVNGFSGGKRNRFDDFIAIRQSNAHSWVEVFLPTQRCDENNECVIVGSWRTVDPTPSSEMGRLNPSVTRDFVDAIQLKWNQYVIRYNLNTQLTWVKGAFEWLTPAPPKATRASASNHTPSTNSQEAPSSMRFWLIPLTLLVVLIWRRLRGRREEGRQRHSSSLQRLIHHFNQSDLGLRRDETLREWVRRIESDRGSSPPLRTWLKQYETHRYNQGKVEPSELAEYALKTIQHDQQKRSENGDPED